MSLKEWPSTSSTSNLDASGLPKQSGISSPLVRVIGDCAVITYIRVCQRLNSDGSVPSSAFEETRIWEKKDGEWKHIHFHRSHAGAPPLARGSVSEIRFQ